MDGYKITFKKINKSSHPFACTCLIFVLQYLSEVTEVEGWINDKMAVVVSTDYGKDENAADKLLTKHKVRSDFVDFSGKHTEKFAE